MIKLLACWSKHFHDSGCRDDVICTVMSVCCPLLHRLLHSRKKNLIHLSLCVPAGNSLNARYSTVLASLPLSDGQPTT